eukprot:36294_1
MDVQSLSKVHRLMNKQTTLVMVSTVSTSILWTVANVLHFMNSFMQVLVYLDISINCLCLWLMFPWNERLYIKFCRPCAALNDFCCSNFKKSQRLRQIGQSIALQKTKNSKEFHGPTLHIHPRIADEATPHTQTENDTVITDPSAATTSNG